MKIIFELKSLEDAKTLANDLLISSEEAHDRGDDGKEALFHDLWDQALKQLDQEAVFGRTP